jgi:hypothetical protein
VGAELSSWTDLGVRWPSRLVATAEEDRLTFRRNSIDDFWFRLSQCHRGVLSLTLNPNWEEMLSIQFGRQGGVTHQLGGEPKMRFYATALVLMVVALMMLTMTLLITTSGP